MQVTVSLRGRKLEGGMLFPFHLAKRLITDVCTSWDEYVLIAQNSPCLQISRDDSQVLVLLRTSQCQKFYSFPSEDVVLLDCDNVTCENLAKLLNKSLVDLLLPHNLGIDRIIVTINEGGGQSVSFEQQINPNV